MSLKKFVSIWILVISVLLAFIGFFGLAYQMDIGFWTVMVGLLTLSVSYYLAGGFYYLETRSYKFTYLFVFASIVLFIVVLLNFMPQTINLKEWVGPWELGPFQLGPWKGGIGADISDSFFFSFSLLIFGILGASFAFAPYYKFGKSFRQKSSFFLIYVSILFTLLPLFLIIFEIVSRGLPGISLEFLTEDIQNLGQEGGIFPALVGTIALILVTAVIVLPLGVGTSIYLAEYARRGPAVRVIRTAVNILQGTPSIVHGLFGFAVFVKLFGMCLLSAGLTLAILTLPIVIRSSEEALNAVPNDIRDASLALGATKWQTIKKVVIPPALPGIITGTVLGLGRAAGETAPILFTGVIFSGAGIPNSIFSRFQALPFHLLRLYRLIGYKDVEQNAWATALLLLIIVLGINVTAIILREKYRQRF